MGSQPISVSLTIHTTELLYALEVRCLRVRSTGSIVPCPVSSCVFEKGKFLVYRSVHFIVLVS